jgi:hypothetical protein
LKRRDASLVVFAVHPGIDGVSANREQLVLGALRVTTAVMFVG